MIQLNTLPHTEDKRLLTHFLNPAILGIARVNVGKGMILQKKSYFMRFSKNWSFCIFTLFKKTSFSKEKEKLHKR